MMVTGIRIPTLRGPSRGAAASKPDGERGFTLIEVIAVLAVLGMLLMMVNFGSVDTTRPEVEKIRNDIRYAQAMAMTHGATWGINFANGTYFVWQGTTATKKTIPGNTSPDVSLGGVSGPTYSLSFNSWGIPFNNTSGLALTADLTLAFSKSGQTVNVVITSDTGQVQ